MKLNLDVQLDEGWVKLIKRGGKNEEEAKRNEEEAKRTVAAAQGEFVKANFAMMFLGVDEIDEVKVRVGTETRAWLESLPRHRETPEQRDARVERTEAHIQSVLDRSCASKLWRQLWRP